MEPRRNGGRHAHKEVLHAVPGVARAAPRCRHLGASWRGKKITFRCDCQSVVQAIAARTSRSKGTMHQLRLLSSYACCHGFDFRAEHVSGETNILADPLSRLDLAKFRARCPDADPLPQVVPSVALPSTTL